MGVLLLPYNIQVPPVVLVSLPDVTLLFEGGQSVVALVSGSLDVMLLMLLFEGGESAVVTPRLRSPASYDRRHSKLTTSRQEETPQQPGTRMLCPQPGTGYFEVK